MTRRQTTFPLVSTLALLFGFCLMGRAQTGSALKDTWKRATNAVNSSVTHDANRSQDINNEVPGTLHNPVPIIKDIVLVGSEQFVTLTSFRINLFAIHNKPELLTDAFVAKFIETQVSAEQNANNFLTSPRNVIRIIKSYEYQTALETQPQFANTALLGTFLYPQAGWSWMKDRPKDDDFYAVVFLYSKQKLLGREPAFLVRDLAPFTKQTLLLASQHAPHLVWQTVRLPDWKYDSASDTVRFLSNNQAAPFLDEVDVLQPAPNEAFRGIKEVPSKPEYPSYYTTASLNGNKYPDTYQPGRCTPACPNVNFREQSAIFAAGAAKFPNFGLLILDHKTVVRGINVHSAQAEALTQAHAKISARLMFELDDLAIAENASALVGQESFRTLALYATVRSIDFVDENANVISSIPGAELPVGSVFTAIHPFRQKGRPVPADKQSGFVEQGHSLSPRSDPTRSTSPETPEQRHQQQLEQLRTARLAQCQRYASSRFPDTSSNDYKNAYAACSAKVSDH